MRLLWSVCSGGIGDGSSLCRCVLGSTTPAVLSVVPYHVLLIVYQERNALWELFQNRACFLWTGVKKKKKIWKVRLMRQTLLICFSESFSVPHCGSCGPGSGKLLCGGRGCVCGSFLPSHKRLLPVLRPHSTHHSPRRNYGRNHGSVELIWVSCPAGAAELLRTFCCRGDFQWQHQ